MSDSASVTSTDSSLAKPKSQHNDKIISICSIILGFLDKKHDAFLKAMNEGEDRLDFQDA
jgi:hypothetical protein